MKIILRLSLIVLLIAGLTATSFAQNPPVFSQFFANPYQFNPSYAASNGYAEANVFYRKQWLGIDNTPTTAAFNIATPIGRNVSLGLLGYSDKSALLTNTSVMATFGYRVRFNLNHHLNFGISAGAGFNNFDLSAIESTNDPALANITQNNTYLNGQFGFNYQWKNLNVGFAFPKLFNSQPNSVKSFNEVELDKFDNRFASASYSFNAGDIRITPAVAYRSIGSNQNQLEGLLLGSYKNLVWLGGSYRDGYGITGFIGINIKGLLRLGYAYEKATGDIADVVDGAHEIYIGARLQKRNREEEWAAQRKMQDSLSLASAPKEKPLPVEEKVTEKEEDKPATEEVKPVVIEKEEPPVVPAVTEPPQEKKEEVVEEKIAEPVIEAPVEVKEAPVELVKETPQPETVEKPTLAPGYYLVVGVYKKSENADKQMQNLKSKGMKPSVLYYPEKDFYYVYTRHSLNREEIVNALKILRRQNQFFASWLFTVPQR
jgi:type IX secretion system PorP/SprF family membrane protein